MDNLTPAVPARIAQFAAAFSHPEPMRRGSLYARRMKCGQAACACQHDPKAAHGPYFTLTQKVEGKTRSRYISPEQAAVVRRQIESGRQFRERVEAYQTAHPCKTPFPMSPGGDFSGEIVALGSSKSECRRE